MNPSTFLAELRERGVRVVLEGDELKLRGSAQALTPRVLAAAKAYKPALRELLLLEAASQGMAPVEAEPEAQVLAGPSSGSGEQAASTCRASPEHLRFSREVGHILGVFPSARLMRSGLWKIDAQDGTGAHHYDHESALRLCAYTTGITSNGLPLEHDAGDAFHREAERLPDPDAADALDEAVLWARGFLGPDADAGEVQRLAELTLDERRAARATAFEAGSVIATNDTQASCEVKESP